MRVLILGGDGYLGWPTAMHFAARGHDVWTVDNYLRRRISLETDSEALIRTPALRSPGPKNQNDPVSATKPRGAAPQA